MIKAIVFDCFGVIREDAFDAAYLKFGGDIVKDKDFIKQTIESSHTGKIASSHPVFAERLEITLQEWRTAIDTGSTLKLDVLDFVLELRKKYKTALLSNIGKGGLERMFEPGFLDKHFDVHVGSGDIGLAKPEAQAYGYIADKLGLRMDECVFIDDRQDYVDGGNSAGMHAILFTSLEKLKSDLGVLLK